MTKVIQKSKDVVFFIFSNFVLLMCFVVFLNGCGVTEMERDESWYQKVIKTGEKQGVFLEPERVDFADVVVDDTMMTTVSFYKYEYLAKDGQYVEMWIYESGAISVFTYPDENKVFDDVKRESFEYSKGKIVG